MALYMGIGIWLFGPSSMTIIGLLSGGGHHPWGIVDYGYILLFSIVPVYTLMMSAYDGTIIAVLVGSALMVIMHIWLERDNWLIPPRLKKMVHLRRVSLCKRTAKPGCSMNMM